jgi:cell division septation protein DedD
MKKIIFIVFFSLIFVPTIFALDLPNFSKIKINQNIFDVLTQPTATPTQTPTNTPAPTIQPTPTEAPIPTETPASTQLKTTQTPSPQLSPTNIQKTPTPTQKPSQRLTQKEMIMYGVSGFLVLVVLLQNFPKIKKWLHEKTE